MTFLTEIHSNVKGNAYVAFFIMLSSLISKHVSHILCFLNCFNVFLRTRKPETSLRTKNGTNGSYGVGKTSIVAKFLRSSEVESPKSINEVPWI